MGRFDFFFRRVIFGIITLAVILTFNFYLFRIVPGDPVSMVVNPRKKPATRELVSHQYGLDKPVWINMEAFCESGELSALFDSQYFLYLKNLSQGNLGVSLRQKKPVSELINSRLGPTLLLILVGEVTAILLGTFVGVIAAWKARSKIDAGALAVGLTAWSMPPFWLGIVLLTLARGILPSGVYMTIGKVFRVRMKSGWM